MTTLLQNTGFTIVDYSAVAFFFFSWVLHYWMINISPWAPRTISQRIAGFRQLWMHNMVHREPKMVDALIQNTLQYGVLFFASTSILLVGALMAGLGASDEAVELLSEIPFVTNTTRTAWEIKVLLIIFIFTFAFFKFAWSYRLFNYVLVLLGAAPDVSVTRALSDLNPAMTTKTDDEMSAEYTRELQYRENYGACVGQLHSLAAKHFTSGLNSYFFALAAAAWFIDPRVFLLATIWVSVVLYRRAFGSRFLRILTAIDDVKKP